VIVTGALMVIVTWSEPVEQAPVGVFVVTFNTAVPEVSEGVYVNVVDVPDTVPPPLTTLQIALVALPERVFVKVTVDPEHILKSGPASTAAKELMFTDKGFEVVTPHGFTAVTVMF
jgi:hypothetical protein